MRSAACGSRAARLRGGAILRQRRPRGAHRARGQRGALPRPSRLSAGGAKLTLRAVQSRDARVPARQRRLRQHPGRRCARFNLTVQRVRVQGGSHVEDQEIFPAAVDCCRATSGMSATCLRDSELVRLVGEVPAERPDRTLDAAGGSRRGLRELEFGRRRRGAAHATTI